MSTSAWGTARECTIGTATFRVQNNRQGRWGVEHVQDGNPPEWEDAVDRQGALAKYAASIILEVTHLLVSPDCDPSIAECAAALAEAHYATEGDR